MQALEGERQELASHQRTLESDRLQLASQQKALESDKQTVLIEPQRGSRLPESS